MGEDGEALAERGWRVLGETCAEILAVGKEADGLALPFPMLDDESDERAPVFGVIAGLRAASHEECVVLPVDCPLVTCELLRELLAAGAVPQTGPLPARTRERRSRSSSRASPPASSRSAE